eukprot:44467-Ditylum_brightwellii.AAC.1
MMVVACKNEKNNNLLPYNYKPELDSSEYLNDTMANHYLQLVGILRWAVELGRIDIATEVSVMLQHNAAPHAGHLEAVYGIFYCLSKHDMSQIPFDGKLSEVDERAFHTGADWKDFYGEVKEEIPDNMPTPLGR